MNTLTRQPEVKFHGDSAGEAFAKCLLTRPNAVLIKCVKMGINPKDNNPDPAFGVTEWPAPPVQRQPEEPPYKEPAPKVPFYKQPADPMPAMKEWYEKALAKQQAEEGVLGSGT